MDRVDSARSLKLFLEERGIPVYNYSIGSPADDSLCLTLEFDGTYHVFILDHGVRFEEKIFDKESDACKYFAKRIVQY